MFNKTTVNVFFNILTFPFPILKEIFKQSPKYNNLESSFALQKCIVWKLEINIEIMN